mgnify:CR=1 FL=1
MINLNFEGYNLRPNTFESMFGSANKLSIKPGDRIAQLIIEKCHTEVKWNEMKTLEDSQRGEGGFGKVFRAKDLSEIFIVSSVIVSEEAHLGDAQVRARHAPGVRCPRSWRWVPKLVNVDPWGEVSPRCAEVLAKLA